MAPTFRPASATERSVSAVIALALVGIAAWVLVIQGDFPPDKYRSAGTGGAGIAARPEAATPLRLPEDALALAAPETFDSRTLSDKINGRAELYLGNGFSSLRCRRFAPDGAAGDWVEACAFDMANFRNAFAVFGTQRRIDGVPEPAMGPHAYATSQGLFFAHGRYYVEAIASRPDARAMSLVRDFAAAFRADHPADDGVLGEAALFPIKGADAGSMVLLGANAFGSPDLDRVLTMRYDVDGAPVTAFVSHRGNLAEARTLADGWADTLLRYGAVAAVAPGDIPGARALDVLGLHEVVFAVGPVLAGVHEAPTRETAATVALGLYHHLSGFLRAQAAAPEATPANPAAKEVP